MGVTAEEGRPIDPQWNVRRAGGAADGWGGTGSEDRLRGGVAEGPFHPEWTVTVQGLLNQDAVSVPMATEMDESDGEVLSAVPIAMDHKARCGRLGGGGGLGGCWGGVCIRFSLTLCAHNLLLILAPARPNLCPPTL